MSRSFNCPSETGSRSAMHGLSPSFLSLGPSAENGSALLRPGGQNSPANYYILSKSLHLTSLRPPVQRMVAPPTRKGINMETSLPFGSENLWRKSGFKFPETARLYSQREYMRLNHPKAANVATKLFLWKAPTKMRNSR
ncbi:hypothetical protein IFM89_020572 [Coptis chinensis]|uniref:Uncharacterized protein n=1 Tax=Coptis chinensis TaxID=261450 RepID=A0A835M5M0_9MAGN|nr:hypothetical protein IFM89_020572 [Coptis chinensis]